MTNQTIEIEYEAAIHKAVFYVHENGGFLRVDGPDQASFIQRQTTNDIRLLQPGRAILSVLTTPSARILDVLYLHHNSEALSLNHSGEAPVTTLLTLPGKAEDTFRFLKSRIFFMDKVSVTDCSQEFIQIDLFGPKAQQTLRHLGITGPVSAGQTINYIGRAYSFMVIGHEPDFSPGYRLVLAGEKTDIFIDMLQNSGAMKIGFNTLEISRIEAGKPGAGHELIERFTPLEAGLRAAVSDSKGCYTGQEIIARQITYDKISQALCNVRLSHACQDGERLFFDDTPAGILTSTTRSPRFGFIGLAIIRRPFNQIGTQLRVLDQIAVVADMPFK